MIKRELLDEGLRAFLEAATTKKVGLTRVPASSGMPYAIVYPLTSIVGDGSWGDPEDTKDYMYQVTCVGEDPRQTAAMSRSVQGVMVDRGASGYQYALAITGVTVLWRWSNSLGAIIPSGENLYASSDTYTVRAQA